MRVESVGDVCIVAQSKANNINSLLTKFFVGATTKWNIQFLHTSGCKTLGHIEYRSLLEGYEIYCLTSAAIVGGVEKEVVKIKIGVDMLTSYRTQIAASGQAYK